MNNWSCRCKTLVAIWLALGLYIIYFNAALISGPRGIHLKPLHSVSSKGVFTWKGFQFIQELFKTALRLNGALHWRHLLSFGPFSSHTTTWSIHPLAHPIREVLWQIRWKKKAAALMCAGTLLYAANTQRSCHHNEFVNLLSCKGHAQSDPYPLCHTFLRVLDRVV